ncbi:11015_t:CDS:2, partial [Funneliformis geosporum]
MTSLLNINSDVNSINSSVSEVQLSDEQIQEYKDVLDLLADENVIAYGYLLEETIRLTEGLVDRQITNEVVINFVSRAAIHISNRRWIHYGNSTARLELHLRAISSALHILIANEYSAMINTDVRDTLYKSVSKFWAAYRSSKVINANITFSLREIRTCLRKIKDDHNHVNIFDVTSNIVTKEYSAAFGSFINVLDFEYPAGEWFYGWKEIRVEFLKLRQQLSEIDESEKSGRVTEFYKLLLKLSTDEFETVKKKNTKFRNFEYKVLKYGGRIAGCSLPDHIDTLLIGYLDLIQRMLTEFVPQMSIHTQEIIGFCNEIYESHIKKQLTCKAVEVLYVTKKFYRGRQVKNMIKVNFKFRRPNLKLDSSSRLNRDSIQQDKPLATPTSANISMVSQEKQKRKNRFHSIRNAIVIKSNFREIPTK